MKKTNFLLSAAMLLCATGVSAQEMTERLDSVVVSSSRAGENTPVTFTTLGITELRKANPVNSLPMTLALQPSVVTYNEGGTGLGNSAMTVRGVKGSQINVTLNGITLNDGESQEVFWINIPAMQSMVSGVQLQRGLGTTANGPGAFGASVNMNTAFVTDAPYASAELTGGSYNTLLGTVSAGTGLMKNGFYLSATASGGWTDGYIRHGFVSSASALINAGWLSSRQSLRFTYLMGRQKSGITWDGIDLETYATDRRYNASDKNNDNYLQQHFQLNYTRLLSGSLAWSNTLNYTRGDGYDEYYKTKHLSYFGIPPIVDPPAGDIYADAIYRKGMSNNLYVLNSELRYRGHGLSLTGGVNLSRYEGEHHPTILSLLFAEHAYGDEAGIGKEFLDEFNQEYRWYRNTSRKNDLSAFVRGEYTLTGSLTAYADLQLRYIDLDMDGCDDDFAPTEYENHWLFFNPRAGLSWRFAEGHKAYVSAALGHREPGRSDIKENVKHSVNPIKPESMVDIEAGWKYSSDKLSLGVNVYLMEYSDMLLETGKLSSSGYAIKENVPRAWRRGVELSGAWIPVRGLKLDGNLTLSDNRIKDYVSYVKVDDKDHPDRTEAVAYGDSPMLLSPSVTGMARLSARPWSKGPELSVWGKYVGRQYIDNSGRDIMKIPAYFVSDLSLSQDFHFKAGTLAVTAYVNNLLNRRYYASGWRYEGYSITGPDSLEYYYGVGVYPQATRNAMLKISFTF